MEFTPPFDFTSEMMKDDDIPYDTPMRSYFRGKIVLLTGGTGFLGQLYVEKLLRSEVKYIYMIVRNKKGKAPEERLKEIYTGILFKKLLHQDKDFLKRIRIIEGDLLQLKLGISDEDLQDIYENVDIVLHAAADVRFDETLRKLLMVNLRGTRELLQISENMKKLQVFAYVSTAFSHCYRTDIDEKFYKSPQDPELMIKYAEKVYEDPSQIPEIIQDRIIHPWPNTYTFSKSLSEELVRRWGEKFPICIIRPTIVISTHEDPVPAWCNNIYGLNGVLVACGMGVLRLMPLNEKLIGDVVCADFVINSTLAAIWYTHTENQENRLLKKMNDTDDGKAILPNEPEIYHISTYQDRPATWGEISRAMKNLFEEYPAKRMLWKHCPNSCICPFMWKVLSIYYHVIPAIFFDLYLAVTDKKIRLLPVYRKVQRFMVALKYFMTHEWAFTNTNMKKILAKMSKEDHEFFPSDVRRYKWSDFSYNYNHGLKLYIGHEIMEDVPKAKKRYNRLKILHYLILTIYYGVHAIIYYKLLQYFGIIDGLKNSVIDTYEFIKDPNKFEI